MNVTIRQVAREAGLCHQTVSDILNVQRGRWQNYAVQTRERVERVAHELGYRRNLAAKAMAAGRHMRASLILSDDGRFGGVPEALLRGLSIALSLEGYSLDVSIVSDVLLTSEQYVRDLLRDVSSDGLLIDYTAKIPTRLIELIDHYQIPAVWLNTQQGKNCVYLDDFNAARQLTEMMLAKEHRRIAFVGPNDLRASGIACHYSVHDRAEGVRFAMKQAGLVPIEYRFTYEQTPMTQWLEQMPMHLLQGEDRPTAIITYSESTPLLMHIAAAGMRVPADISLATFSSIPVFCMGRPMTHAFTSADEMARVAVRKLLALINDPSHTPFDPVSVPLEIHAGVTLGTPKN